VTGKRHLFEPRTKAASRRWGSRASYLRIWSRGGRFRGHDGHSPYTLVSRLCRFRFRLSAALLDADTDVDGGRNDYMARETMLEPLAVTAFGHKEAASALSPRHGLGTDGECWRYADLAAR
jgi:hypothetical protein